mmetsp:Transcript_21849/g.47940  ORF Transcript_21849/g.47940 Transcript_21849/m.47940 type:complete len:635 (+) Transcript_21849:53-1957(+)
MSPPLQKDAGGNLCESRGKGGKGGKGRAQTEKGSKESSTGIPSSSPTDGIGFLQALKEALAVANMKRDTQNQAVAWCESKGFNSLQEVIEAFDEFATGLGLKPLEKRRLEKAVNGAIERYGGGAPKDKDPAKEASIARADSTQAPQEAVAATAEKKDEPADNVPSKDAPETAKEAPSEAPKEEAPKEAVVEEQTVEESARPPQEAEKPDPAAELLAAQAAGDATALAAAIPKADAAGVDADVLAAAKKTLFKLQKEKRDKSKLERAKSQAASELAAAAQGDNAEELRKAIQKAQDAGLLVEETTLARLDVLEQQEKKECIKLAFEDLECAISQDDVESANLALEDASSMGASPEELKEAEEKIAALRMKLDPEGEARRRRVEARKSQGTEKKWNYSGKSDNRIINDRFREHEAELERQRMLAFRARGRFRAEDEGEEGAEKGVRKLRAEVSKELGAVPLPKLNEGQASGFAWGRVPKEETEAPRRISLQVHSEAGAGVDLHPSWWGMVVDGIDPQPGQPGLRLRDTLVEVNGTSLMELSDQDCEQRFLDLFGDGCNVKVEPFVQVSGILAPPAAVDKTSMQSDLERFAADYGIELRMEDAGGNNVRVHMEGSQSAVKSSKPELQNLMQFYCQAS